MTAGVEAHMNKKKTVIIVVSAAVVLAVAIILIRENNRRESVNVFFNGKTMEITDDVKKIEMKCVGGGIKEGMRTFEITDKGIIDKVVSDINSFELKRKKIPAGTGWSMILTFYTEDESFSLSMGPGAIIEGGYERYKYSRKGTEDEVEALYNYLWDVFWKMSEDAGYLLPANRR